MAQKSRHTVPYASSTSTTWRCLYHGSGVPWWLLLLLLCAPAGCLSSKGALSQAVASSCWGA